MSVEVGIWRIDGGAVRRVNTTRLEAERRLEDVLADDLSILGLPPLLILDRQVETDFGSYIDLLAMDAEGSLYVLELKRDRTPRDVVAQALDYGSWVSKLGHERIAEIYERGRFATGGVTLADAFSERFGSELPDTVNESHRLIIVASQLDSSTERIVDYLTEGFGVPINAVFFAYYRDGEAEYLARSWLRDPAEAEAHARPGSKRTREPWNRRDFYVSFGEGPRRDWDDAREFGFISGGGKAWYSQSLFALKPGHRIFVYLPGQGYVGVGEVLEEVKRASEFTVTVDGEEVPVVDAPLRAVEYRYAPDDPDAAEHFVRVRWLATVSRKDAYRERGFFANQNTACQFRHQATLDKLYHYFGIDAAGLPQPSGNGQQRHAAQLEP